MYCHTHPFEKKIIFPFTKVTVLKGDQKIAPNKIAPRRLPPNKLFPGLGLGFGLGLGWGQSSRGQFS